MKLTLYTEGYFSAAHFLNNYEGKCSQIHGHTWKLEVWVRGDEQLKKQNGILWDFHNIQKVKMLLDHTHLNDIIKGNPTAENISLFIYKFFKETDPDLAFRIRIYENPITPYSYCEVGDFTDV